MKLWQWLLLKSIELWMWLDQTREERMPRDDPRRIARAMALIDTRSKLLSERREIDGGCVIFYLENGRWFAKANIEPYLDDPPDEIDPCSGWARRLDHRLSREALCDWIERAMRSFAKRIKRKGRNTTP